MVVISKILLQKIIKEYNKNIIEETTTFFPADRSKTKVYDLLHENLENDLNYYDSSQPE